MANHAATINRVITTSTVLVLGAGASAPYGFPVASELKQQICATNTSGTRIYYYLTIPRVSTKNAARKSNTFSSGKFSNFKRRSVIAMGGSVFADVGREAGGPA
jgi:hypothetical protein